MPEFDAYLMVDWSASSRPVTGSDSVWYCLVVRTGVNLSVAALENPTTRRRAMTEINDILRGLARREQMVLVGFDFPYGYLAGFADALGVTDTPAWIGVWREIVDRDDNSNNRFEVAGNLNCRVSNSCCPFWGCPKGRESATMSCNKGGPGHLAKKRLTDISMNVDRNGPATCKPDRESALPECDFVYFATPACGSWTITAEFVDSAKAIIAHAYKN
jgi:precorrin-8X/cobalt-precorrin-8 methylmutase